MENKTENLTRLVTLGLTAMLADEYILIFLFTIPAVGIDSGIAHDFDPDKNLQELKVRRKNNV